MPINKIKYLEAIIAVLHFINQYNGLIKSQVLEAGASAKVQKFTARHLALSLNCMLLTRDHFVQNIKEHFVDHASNPNGFNIRKVVDT